MKRVLAVALLIVVLVAAGLAVKTAYGTTSTTEPVVVEYYSPLEQEIYISSSERILYVPWKGSLKAFDTFFVSYASINETHDQAKLVIDGAENNGKLGQKLEFTDTEGDKYVAVVEEITCQYTKLRIMSL